MRARFPSPFLVLLASCASATMGGSATDADLVITRVSVVDVEQGALIPDQDVLVKGSRIVGVAPQGMTRLPTGVRTVDGRGRYLIPGLWDMHVHLHGSGNPTGVELPLLVAHGITGVRVLNADRPSVDPMRTPGLAQHRDMQARIAAGSLTGPRIMGLGSWAINGASGISDSMPAFYKARTREEGQQLARYIKERGFDFAKIYNNVSREGYLGLAEEARAIGLTIAGHEPSTLSAIEISNAGQKSIEHSRIFLLNCFAGADSMRNGRLTSSQTVRRRRMVDEYDPRMCAEVFQAFVRNGTWITPTHGTRKHDALAGDSAYRLGARSRYVTITQTVAWLQDADGMVAGDSSGAGRKSYMDFYIKGLSLTNEAYRAGVPVMLGTDAGDSFILPGAGIHDELGELVKAGLTPAEAVRAATLAGAQYFDRTAEFGTVRAGRYADLVLLDANPLADIGNSRRIHAVVLNGRVFSRSALDSMLASVEVAVRPQPQPLLWASAALGDTAGIARALAGGARIDSLDTARGRRALNYAAAGNRGPAVRLLLARGAGINLANNTGFTPVHHAAETGSIDALRILIAAGADISIANKAGALPVETARRRNFTAAVALLEAAKKPQ